MSPAPHPDFDLHEPAPWESPRRASWTAAELMAVEFPEPRWAVPGIIAEGLTLLVGAPKLGKSWLSLNLLLAIASGGKALSSIDVDTGTVLYLALEDNGRRLQRRLRAVLNGEPAPARLHLATALEPLTEGGADRIDRWVTEHPDARLIVIDVLARVRARSSSQVSVYEQDYAAVAALKHIADRHGIAIIVVHHTRKSGADDFLDTVSGSQGLAGAADSIAVLSRSRGSAGAVLKVTGRDIEEAEYALDFDAPTGTWKLLDGPASDYDLGDTRRDILHALRVHGPLTPKALAELTEIKPGTIRLTLRRMLEDGQVGTDGRGLYIEPVTPVTAVTLSPLPGLEGVTDLSHGVTPGDASTSPSYTVTGVTAERAARE